LSGTVTEAGVAGFALESGVVAAVPAVAAVEAEAGPLASVVDFAASVSRASDDGYSTSAVRGGTALSTDFDGGLCTEAGCGVCD